MYSHLNYDGTKLTQPHCKAQSLPVVDRLLEPQTFVKFIEFAFGEPLPNGNQPNIERLAEEEFIFFQQDQSFPPGSNGESIITRVMVRVGSNQDSARLCMVGRNIQSLKSRLWEGIVPLSEQLWQEKGLDQPNKFDLACQHLSAVIAVFQYLNQRPVRSNLRQTFNFIYDTWAMLDTVLNERRAAKSQAPVSVAALWTMYMKAHFEMMTERAHRWVIVHVNALRGPLLRTLSEHRTLHEGESNHLPDSLQWQITDSLQVLGEITANADFAIMIPMNDYKGYTLPQGIDSTALHAAHFESRTQAYHDEVRRLTRVNMLCGLNSRARPSSSGESYCESALCQIEAQNQVRREMRGAPIEPIPREPWIVKCASMMKSGTNTDTEKKYGLAVYRLTYGQTESEWAAFVEKVEAHVSDWGKGQTGSSTIKTKLKLHWLDGQELSIPEGDVEAAKIHFKALTNDSQLWSEVQDRAFLAVDSSSFASYTTNVYGPATSQLNPGDFVGFLLAVDPDFDAKDGPERPDECPGYSGQMHILGSLIWGDLYSRLVSQSANLEDLWPLAIEHPNLVYVGSTIPSQRATWSQHIGMRWALLRAVVDQTKGKLNMPTIPSPQDQSTKASPPTTAPSRQPDASETPQRPPSPTSTASSFTEPSPLDAALRTYVLSEFQRYLRSQGQTVPAAMAEELLRIRPNERPDPSRIQHWAAVEEERQAQRSRDGQEDEATEEYQPQCPFQ